MNRRQFLSVNFRQGNTDGIEPTQQISTTTLAPYNLPLTLEDAYHLLRRISFAPTVSMAQALVGKTSTEAVNLLLGDTIQEITTKPNWIDEVTENPRGADIFTQNSIYGKWSSQFANFQQWWIDRMIKDTFGTMEKLTVFWSGHFTTEFAFDESLIPPQQLFRQFLIFHADKLSDFKKLVFDITLDGAMLVYLGGNLNSKGKPNENYARELMELYSTGIGQYTEGDVQEAARVLTGWKVGMFNDEPALNGYFASYFSPTAHDQEAKQFMGVTIPARDNDSNTEYLVKNEEVQKLIDILFERRTQAIAKFMARKIYLFFVYSNPNIESTAVNELAEIFIKNNFAIKPTLMALFASEHFFDEANRGTQIKTPLEFVVGLARQLSVTTNSPVTQIRNFEQSIMDPPNVAGWEGYRTWISTKTYPLRRKFALDTINAMTDQQLLSFAKQFPDYDNAEKLTRHIEHFLLPKSITDERHIRYRNDYLLQKQPDYEWPEMVNNVSPAARGIKALLTVISKAPDFQLC